MGYINWLGFVENESSIILNNTIKDYWGVGERFGIVPVNSNAFYWAGCKVMPVNSAKEIKNAKEYLIHTFNDWPQLIINVIKKTKDNDINAIPVYDLDPSPIFFRENIVLLGDAAHAAGPTSSQGACLAIEDAFCLANLLSDTSMSMPVSYTHLTLPTIGVV